jgi:hypothetical protein
MVASTVHHCKDKVLNAFFGHLQLPRPGRPARPARPAGRHLQLAT